MERGNLYNPRSPLLCSELHAISNPSVVDGGPVYALKATVMHRLPPLTKLRIPLANAGLKAPQQADRPVVGAPMALTLFDADLLRQFLQDTRESARPVCEYVEDGEDHPVKESAVRLESLHYSSLACFSSHHSVAL